MKKLILFFFIIIFLIGTSISCNNESDNTGKSNTFKPFLTNKSETGKIIAALERNKENFKKLDPVEFKLKLSDDKGNKIDKAVVTIDLTMPGMTMPQNKILLKEKEIGTYTGTALFTMKGKWRLITSIDISKQKEIIYFDLIVE